MRGEQSSNQRPRPAHRGSSPRARGAGLERWFVDGSDRFIPACAGSRAAVRCLNSTCTVHPRVRGEQKFSCVFLEASVGSSPRARGADKGQIGLTLPARFIPACAGSRTTSPFGRTARSVHPRVRGEQEAFTYLRTLRAGSSPRARGAGPDCAATGILERFIPACAGSRGMMCNPCMLTMVHPRVRGEQCLIPRSSSPPLGSSPRARGAGPPPALWPLLSAVHPRVRGEQHQKRCQRQRGRGSSPRARGAVVQPG